MHDVLCHDALRVSVCERRLCRAQDAEPKSLIDMILIVVGPRYITGTRQ